MEQWKFKSFNLLIRLTLESGTFKDLNFCKLHLKVGLHLMRYCQVDNRLLAFTRMTKNGYKGVKPSQVILSKTFSQLLQLHSNGLHSHITSIMKMQIEAMLTIFLPHNNNQAS